MAGISRSEWKQGEKFFPVKRHPSHPEQVRRGFTQVASHVGRVMRVTDHEMSERKQGEGCVHTKGQPGLGVWSPSKMEGGCVCVGRWPGMGSRGLGRLRRVSMHRVSGLT